MTRSRRVCGLVAAAWLSCQVGGVALATIVWVAGANAEQTLCTCTHGADAICPMHHQVKPGSRVCVMKSLNDPAAFVFASLLGLAVPIPEAGSLGDLAPDGTVAIAARSPNGSRPTPPDPPPPRW